MAQWLRADCYSRGLKFNYQNPHDSSQLAAIPVPGSLQALDIYIRVSHNNHTYKNHNKGNQKHYLKEKEINSVVFYVNEENGNKTKPNL